QANFPRPGPPVQLEIADAVVKESQLISALVLPVTRNIQLSNHRLQFFQASLKIHRKINLNSLIITKDRKFVAKETILLRFLTNVFDGLRPTVQRHL
ncbi:MAG: hypothetical protein ACJ0GY_09990, partial [Synechococcus sp.]